MDALDQQGPEPGAQPSSVPDRADGTVSMRHLDPAHALRLLAAVSLGRVVFTRHALPAIRPVNHLVENGEIIIRTHEGAALTTATQQVGAEGVVVAYEADQIDPDTHTGWSVIVTGYAHLVTDPADAARYAGLLRPWVDQTMDYTVRIHPEQVTGFELVELQDAAEA